jgi:hypothetical protein
VRACSVEALREIAVVAEHLIAGRPTLLLQPTKKILIYALSLGITAAVYVINTQPLRRRDIAAGAGTPVAAISHDRLVAKFLMIRSSISPHLFGILGSVVLIRFVLIVQRFARITPFPTTILFRLSARAKTPKASLFFVAAIVFQLCLMIFIRHF